jgi:hypothetical protein
MTKSEQRLLSVLFVLIIIFATVIIVQSNTQEKNQLISEIIRLEDQYQRLVRLQTALNKANEHNEQLEESIAAASQFFQTDLDIYQQGSDLKDFLSNLGLDPRQFSVNEELRQIEFNVQASSWSFLRAIEEIQNQTPAVRFNTINIRRLSDGSVQGLVRLSYAELEN